MTICLPPNYRASRYVSDPVSMPRSLLPAALATCGVLGAAGLALTTYTAPIRGASSDPALYNLIAGALHDSLLTPGPHLGLSPLPVGPSPAASESAALRGQIERSDAPSGPATWAARAARADSGALRDWLGRWVLATSVTKGDTVRMTLRRWSSRPGCPWVSSLVATTGGVLRGEYRLVDIRATCPAQPQPASARVPGWTLTNE